MRTADGEWIDVRKATGCVSRSSIIIHGERACRIRTRYDISRIHGVFVLDEAEAIHKLNLGDLACAMSVEVVLDIGLGS